MRMVVANAVKLDMLARVIAGYATGLKLRLFVNDYTPVAGMDPSSFVAPADSGYAQISLPAWGAPALVGNRARSTMPVQTWVFTHSAGNFTIYGYWIYDSVNDRVMLAQRADTPEAITGVGQPFSVAPRLDLDSIVTDP